MKDGLCFLLRCLWASKDSLWVGTTLYPSGLLQNDSTLKIVYYFYKHVNSTKPKVTFQLLYQAWHTSAFTCGAFWQLLISWADTPHLFWNLPWKALLKSPSPFRWNDSGRGCSSYSEQQWDFSLHFLEVMTLRLLRESPLPREPSPPWLCQREIQKLGASPLTSFSFSFYHIKWRYGNRLQIRKLGKGGGHLLRNWEIDPIALQVSTVHSGHLVPPSWPHSHVAHFPSSSVIFQAISAFRVSTSYITQPPSGFKAPSPCPGTYERQRTQLSSPEVASHCHSSRSESSEHADTGGGLKHGGRNTHHSVHTNCESRLHGQL